MSDNEILVRLAKYEDDIEDNRNVYFDCNCLWYIEEKSGNLILLSGEAGCVGTKEVATFPRNEWRYIRRVDKNG